METLLSRFENDHLKLSFRAIPKPLPVILYLARPARDQAETLYRIREWVAFHGTSGVAKIQEILSQKGDSEPDTYGLYEELSEILFQWRCVDEFPDQGRTKARLAEPSLSSGRTTTPSSPSVWLPSRPQRCRCL